MHAIITAEEPLLLKVLILPRQTISIEPNHGLPSFSSHCTRRHEAYGKYCNNFGKFHLNFSVSC